MDLVVYYRVLWRARRIVIPGLVIALLFAAAAFIRQSQVWESKTTLFVTQQGFPAGRAIFDEVVPIDPQPRAGGYVPRFGDPGRFISLAILYSHLANSDAVRMLIRQNGPLNGKYQAAPVPSDDGNGYLPLINVTATSTSIGESRRLTRRATRALRAYIDREQDLNAIPPDKRVLLPVLTQRSKAELVAGRTLTRPIFVFMLAAMATVGLAFLVENLRPRIQAVPDEDAPPAPARRSA